MFRARLPSVFITSHKIQAFYRICTLSPLDAALTLQLSKQTRNTTRLKCCACHAKCPKCCICHEKCNSSSENDAKVLRLSRRTTLDTLYETWNVTECHACRKKRCYATLKSPNVTAFAELAHLALTSDARGRLQTLRT